MTTQHNDFRPEKEMAAEPSGEIEAGRAVGASGAADGVMTLEQLLAFCVRLQPVEAAQCGDSDLCVTPLITRLLVDGQLVDLKLKDGRWAGGYPRVSGEVQRAAGSAAGKTHKKVRLRKSTQQVAQMAQGQEGLEDVGMSAFSSKGAADGYSEEEQLVRQIRHFVRQGWAFKIYSDCGLTGEYPSNDPRLIKRLLEGKAARYKKIYERTLLDETSLLRRTPEQIASMGAYLKKRVALIKGGQITDSEFAPSEDDSGDDLVSKTNLVSKSVGRPRRKVFFRQAFTQLWKDIEAGKVHTVAVSDRSRLCRAADLESEFLLLLSRHQTRLVGLIEDLSTLDVSDPLRKGFAYMIASVNEYRLEEICGHSFRGLLQLLESGHPHGRPPWWLIRDVQGKAVEMPAYVPHARRIAELYMAGLGVAAIITKLHDEGVRIGGEPLTRRMVSYVLDSDAVAGLHWQFGLAWNIYPPLLTPDAVAELRERRQSRRDLLIPTFGARQPGRTWANHLFTGLLRCSCGYLLRYSPPSRTPRAAGSIAYYFCPAPHKRAPDEPAHAWMNENKLSAFLSELLTENPHLIANALSAGGDRTARSAARRTLLEERLQQARQIYAAQEAEAQEKAMQAALSAGLRESSSSFSSVVTEIQRGLLDAERSALTALEAELEQLGAEAGQDKQAARILSAVGHLQVHRFLEPQSSEGTILEDQHLQDPPTQGLQTGTLDILTQNNLLKAIFSEIAVYPMGYKKKWKTAACEGTESGGTKSEGANNEKTPTEKTPTEKTPTEKTPTEKTPAEKPLTEKTPAGPCGCLVMRLAGVDTPLPPVRLRRLKGKDVRLPSVEEWITDIYSLSPVEDGLRDPSVKARHAFYYVLRRLVGSLDKADPVGQLMQAILSDKDFPRRSKGKETVAAHLAQSNLYSAVREHFEAAWTLYLATERRRLGPGQEHRPA